MAMQINSVISPQKEEIPYGYTPMDVAVEIDLAGGGSQYRIMPLEVDNKTRLRMWLPDLPRTSGVAPIMGSDKLDYYHPQRKPNNYEAMIDLLEANRVEIPELEKVLEWMRSDRPLQLEAEILNRPKTELLSLAGGRIVWRLDSTRYLHELPEIQKAHVAKTMSKALGGNSGGAALAGPLPRVHSKKLAAPLLGCNDEMFCAWGQDEKAALNISAVDALQASQRYTELLEAKGHSISMGDGLYWIWGASRAMVEISEAVQEMARFMGTGDEDPIAALQDLIAKIYKGAKSTGKIPEDLNMFCGYIGMGGSGEGRLAVGQMTPRSTVKFLQNLLYYHERQQRYMNISKPFWVFGALTTAEGSSKRAIAKANKQIFEAMTGGRLPPSAITNSVIHRLKIEGVPSFGITKTNRQWVQLSYLAWLAPDFIQNENNMKPVTTPENLLAWHVGRVFAACKDIAYAYAHADRSTKDTKDEENKSTADKDYRNPIDAYRQILFSAPAQGFVQITAKVSPYLAARPDKAFFYHRVVSELAEDCPNVSPPKRWTEEEAFFLALGMSQFEIALRSDRAKKKAENNANP
jgi:CRISPR-associated protein (Cas_Csd1)